jgi:hypothetical protein
MRESETFIGLDVPGDSSDAAIGNGYPMVVLDLAELESIDAARLAGAASATPRRRLSSNPNTEVRAPLSNPKRGTDNGNN